MPGMSPFKEETKSVLKRAVNSVKKKEKLDFISIDRSNKPEKVSAKQESKRKPRTLPDNKQKRGVVYLSHIPPGFFEDEMRQYFNQFGHVSNLKLARSEKNGNSMGYAFIEFRYAEVAQVVAETMNNYIMCNRVLKAKFIPKTFPAEFWRQVTAQNCRKAVNRKFYIMRKNRRLTAEEEMMFVGRQQTRLNEILEKLKAKDVQYNLKPTLPKQKKQQVESRNQAIRERYTPIGDSMVSLPVMEVDESDPEIDFMTPPNVRKLKLRTGSHVQLSMACDTARLLPGTRPGPSARIKGAIAKAKPQKPNILKKLKVPAKTGGIQKAKANKTGVFYKDKVKKAVTALGGVKELGPKNKVGPLSPEGATRKGKSRPGRSLKSPSGKKNAFEKKLAKKHTAQLPVGNKPATKPVASSKAPGKKTALKKKLVKKLAAKKQAAVAAKKGKKALFKNKLAKKASPENPAVASKGKKALFKKKLTNKVAAKKSAGETVEKRKEVLLKKGVKKNRAAKEGKQTSLREKVVKKITAKKQAVRAVEGKKKSLVKKKLSTKAATAKAATVVKAIKKAVKRKPGEAAGGKKVEKAAKKKKQLIKVVWKPRPALVKKKGGGGAWMQVQ